MMLETLKCTTDLLDEHKIPYFIDTGTLLGAVRHGGFMSPADREDVDLGIMRVDEPKLRSLQHVTWQRCGFPMIHRSDRWVQQGHIVCVYCPRSMGTTRLCSVCVLSVSDKAM